MTPMVFIAGVGGVDLFAVGDVLDAFHAGSVGDSGRHLVCARVHEISLVAVHVSDDDEVVVGIRGDVVEALPFGPGSSTEVCLRRGGSAGCAKTVESRSAQVKKNQEEWLCMSALSSLVH